MTQPAPVPRARLRDLCSATTVTGYRGTTVEALPLDRVRELFRAYGRA